MCLIENQGGSSTTGSDSCRHNLPPVRLWVKSTPLSSARIGQWRRTEDGGSRERVIRNRQTDLARALAERVSGPSAAGRGDPGSRDLGDAGVKSA